MNYFIDYPIIMIELTESSHIELIAIHFELIDSFLCFSFCGRLVAAFWEWSWPENRPNVSVFLAVQQLSSLLKKNLLFWPFIFYVILTHQVKYLIHNVCKTDLQVFKCSNVRMANPRQEFEVAAWFRTW